MAAHGVVIGKITGVHGVQGWLKFMPYTQEPENAARYQPWLLGEKPVTVTDYRRNGKGLLVKLDKLDDRDEAKALVGQQVSVERTALPALEKGHYWADLIGLQVINTEGKALGIVDSMLETGANDVLVVKQGKHEFAVPYRLGSVITEIDLVQGTITVDWNDED